MTVFEDLDRRLLPGFERREIDVGDGPIRTLVGGSGPPVLMLHGDPQTHLCWHKIAPALAKSHSIVLTDLRGRGESHKPGPSPDHRAYRKRVMAQEQLAVMAKLGFARFSLVGHDRGARVARRMALDHPAAVQKLAVMDIVPALDFYERTTAEIAQAYYYFFFLTQAHPMTERLIAGDPRAFMREILTGLGGTVPYDPEVLELYLQASTSQAAVAAICECFRAGITLDVEDDRADRREGRQIACPSLVMWGEKGVVGRHFDIEAIWTAWARDVQFEPVPCGHFLPEEAAEAVSEKLMHFLQ